jgi:predicted nucleotidyltransferase component of viral defense system
MDRKVTNTAASVRQRLLNRARAEGRAFQELATLYAMERFLYRLGRSPHAESFVLKGGLMTMTWAGEYARLTRDIDLLGRGTNSIEAVVASIREVVALEVEDGVRFDAEGVQGAQINAEAAHVGVRVVVPADFGGMALKMQIDVGFGDAVVPDPLWIVYPQLLDLGQPRLLGYPPEATLAEKLHAVVHLGLANSRMKDYYDLWTAQRLGITTPERLGTSLQHTFERRATELPAVLPEGLTHAFATDAAKRAQWAGFLRKSHLTAPDLVEVVASVADLAAAGFAAARSTPRLGLGELTISEAATLLGVASATTVENWLAGGHFPGAFQNADGHWRFPRHEVEAVKRRVEELGARNARGELAPDDRGDMTPPPLL